MPPTTLNSEEPVSRPLEGSEKAVAPRMVVSEAPPIFT